MPERRLTSLRDDVVQANRVLALDQLPVTTTEASICDEDVRLVFNQNTDLPPFGTYGQTCEKVVPAPQAQSLGVDPLVETQMHIAG